MTDGHGPARPGPPEPHPIHSECPFIRSLVSPLFNLHTQTPLEAADLHKRLPVHREVAATRPAGHLRAPCSGRPTRTPAPIRRVPSKQKLRLCAPAGHRGVQTDRATGGTPEVGDSAAGTHAAPRWRASAAHGRADPHQGRPCRRFPTAAPELRTTSCGPPPGPRRADDTTPPKAAASDHRAGTARPAYKRHRGPEPGPHRPAAQSSAVAAGGRPGLGLAP